MDCALCFYKDKTQLRQCPTEFVRNQEGFVPFSLPVFLQRIPVVTQGDLVCWKNIFMVRLRNSPAAVIHTTTSITEWHSALGGEEHLKSPQPEAICQETAAYVCYLPSCSSAPACEVKGIAPSPSEIYRTSIWGTWDRLWPPSAGNKNVTPFCTPERELAAILRETCGAVPQKQPLNYTWKRAVTATQPIPHFTSRQVLLYF